MAFRSLLHFSETSSRCFWTTVGCHRPHSIIFNSSKHTRGFKKIGDGMKQSESQVGHSLSKSTVTKSRNLWKPFGFTILFGSAVQMAVGTRMYETVRKESDQYTIMRPPNWGVKRPGWRGDMQHWWRCLSPGEKVFAPICFLNVIVFLAWKVPRFQSTMIRYFCTTSGSHTTCWPMLLSTFSHNSLPHLALNMYALYSFCPVAVAVLGPDEFIAVYLTGGVVASFASHLYKTILSRPALSLGASGAIMTVISFICMRYPESRLSIAFLPMFTFTAGNTIKAFLLLDTSGCILGWRFLDHAAHLGGALFGIFWNTWGVLYTYLHVGLTFALLERIRGLRKPSK